jgi:hypothetical protein
VKFKPGDAAAAVRFGRSRLPPVAITMLEGNPKSTGLADYLKLGVLRKTRDRSGKKENYSKMLS